MPSSSSKPPTGLASVAIHFDSLFKTLELAGLPPPPPGIPDPSYSRIMGRFQALAQAHGFKFTVFVVGGELRDPSVSEAVRLCSRMGHEVANHSLSHHHDLGMRPRAEIRSEVLRAHEAILRATGQEPRGFVSPAWNWSPALLEVLAEAGYRYDASFFPSPLLRLISLKVALNSRGRERWGICSRSPASRGRLPTEAHEIQAPGGRLLEIPLPVTRLGRIPCYHTLSFVLGPRLLRRVLESCLSSCTNFYYVMHPMDLFDPLEDLPPGHGLDLGRIERALVPIGRKWSYAEEALSLIAGRRRIVPLAAMAQTAAAAAAR